MAAERGTGLGSMATSMRVGAAVRQMPRSADAAFNMFCALESCGKCTPCRIGSVRGRELIDHIIAGREVTQNLATLRELCDTMISASLCALGGMAPFPVLSALEHFPEDFVVRKHT